MFRTVAILTDFGTQDSYVGIMKGVIRRINPFCVLIDINHNIPAGDILAAAFNLEISYKYFPEDTVFLCVVDPGVGSKRRAVAIETDGRIFVAPDNGLLSHFILNEKISKCVSLTNPEFHLPNKSSTFHGRDIFAPAAAYLSKNTGIEELGEIIEVSSLVKIDLYAEIENNMIHGKIIHIDNFGNLITNIRSDMLKNNSNFKLIAGRYEFDKISETYSNVPAGELLVYKGSSGYIEIAENLGRASDLIGKGEEITVEFCLEL